MPSRALLAIVMLGLLLRIVYVAAIYQPGLAAYHGGDYKQYQQAAEPMARGDFSFSNDVYLSRPPLFPLLMAALNLNTTLILAANILLSSGIIALSYVIARQLQLEHAGGGHYWLLQSWPLTQPA